MLLWCGKLYTKAGWNLWHSRKGLWGSGNWPWRLGNRLWLANHRPPHKGHCHLHHDLLKLTMGRWKLFAWIPMQQGRKSWLHVPMQVEAVAFVNGLWLAYRRLPCKVHNRPPYKGHLRPPPKGTILMLRILHCS